MDSSSDVRHAASTLLAAYRAMLKFDRYDPMSSPPQTEEIEAIDRLRRSVRHASQIEHLFGDDFAEDNRVDDLLERSGLTRAKCRSCDQEILIRLGDVESCVHCAVRVGA